VKAVCFVVGLLQALVRERVALYFTKGSTPAAALFWQELILARFRISPRAQQVYCLSDFSTAAVVHRYPQERVSSPRARAGKHGAALVGVAWSNIQGRNCVLLEHAARGADWLR
jgi:hypothetical protein